MSKKVLVPIADDSEEIETACITDTLVRCGASVVVASVSGKLEVKMSRGLKIVADVLIQDVKDKVAEFDAIVLPGGMPGATRLSECAELTEMLKAQSGAQKVTAAMCASPAVVLAAHDMLPASATCYPADKFKDILGAKRKDDLVVKDGHIITSQGPGTSILFALEIAESLFGKEKADEVGKAMLVAR
mmetsp:Transcript_91229/g.142418  ORF Transcript_91229/g.142418 Transcript_91229/m.142418 type:complete len:188 (-) Transcript_91229:146-709(-)|eukprot:CAMPEP_0169065992 /NCGR_PEP_ID=MMETSP1015-20121227/2709_1 /TAXON_ID=342587 /ORGANISM="Karlodinium micrum, Strain CCMP2283" /LENGTH=187 /DNA_ID=CAMNT_0009124623 /DNA_START=74 /DNA_END=637 /DNA_ORIENTATION=-